MIKPKSWERPFTTKRYLHPPFAEEIVTMWPDLKFVIGEVIVPETDDVPSASFRLLLGDNLDEIDYKQVQYNVRQDGIPIHSYVYDLGDYLIKAEGFCSTDRVPTTFIKFAFKNTSTWKVEDKVAFIVRTGKEEYLTGANVDGYCHYTPNVHTWGGIPPTWNYVSDGLLSDGKYKILFQDLANRFATDWKSGVKNVPWSKQQYLHVGFSLEASEEKSFTVAFGKGDIRKFDYEAEKQKTIDFWNGELSRIEIFPNKENENFYAMYRSLVAQLLQMFACPIGENYVLPRQGGLQRRVWPTEAYEFLKALDRIGDFRKYTGKAYELFFGMLQSKKGEDAGRVYPVKGSQSWARITSAALEGLAYHMIYSNDKEIFEKYRDNAYLAFKWIEKQRHMDPVYKGVFPPMKASDWDEVYRFWAQTDTYNIISYRALAEAFEKFGDPATSEIISAHDDYLRCMKRIYERVPKIETEDELVIPQTLELPPTDPPTPVVYLSDAIMLISSGVVAHESEDAKKLENYYLNRGLMKNGLTGLMNESILKYLPSDPWAGHTWYTSYSDMYWFYHYLAIGEREKAENILVGQLKYGMTPEYYMLERYADNDPYFTPWLPNASANGRTIMMLCDFYGM